MIVYKFSFYVGLRFDWKAVILIKIQKCIEIDFLV